MATESLARVARIFEKEARAGKEGNGAGGELFLWRRGVTGRRPQVGVVEGRADSGASTGTNTIIQQRGVQPQLILVASLVKGEGIRGRVAEPGPSGIPVAGGQPAGRGHGASRNLKAPEADNQGGAPTTPTSKS